MNWAVSRACIDGVCTIVMRMPNKRGFCYMELFSECRKMFDDGKYTFIRNKHTYFGIVPDVRDPHLVHESVHLRGHERQADHKT